MGHYKLLTVDGQPKTRTGEARGYLTGVLHLAPAATAGVGRSVCPDSTAGCRALCLNTAGRGGIPMTSVSGYLNTIQAARIRKTRLFWSDRAAFLAALDDDIDRLCAAAFVRNLSPAVRLNGTSDINWPVLASDIFDKYTRKGVTFYDYTKSKSRALAAPAGYSLTLSATELTTDSDIRSVLGHCNVAVVLRLRPSQPMPDVWHGFPVVDGDKDDLRFLDPAGHVVGLRAKGKARRDTSSGFVRDVGGAP